MSDRKISALTAAGALVGTEPFPIVQDAETRKATPSQLRDYVLASNIALVHANAGIELGSLAAVNTPFIDFHSSGNNIDRDSRLIASGGDASNDGGTLTLRGTFAIEPRASSLKLGLALTQSVSGTTGAGELDLNALTISSDNADSGANPTMGCTVFHSFGGSSMKGGRVAFRARGRFTATSHSANTNRNYVGAHLRIEAADDDGGGVGTEQGAFFGCNPEAIAENGATNLLNLTAGECNIAAKTGSSVKYKSIWALVGRPDDAVQGSTFDCMLALSNQTGAVKWEDGVLIGNMNGEFPIDTSGAILRATTGTVTKGIDLASLTISGNAFASPGFSVNGGGTGLTLSGSNAGIELGSTAGANTPFIDYHSSGNANDGDARLIASGGAASAWQGALAVRALSFNPFSNDLASLGTTTLGWSDVHLAAGGVINWANGAITITDSSDALAHAGAANGYTFDALVSSTAAVLANSGTAIPAGGTAGAGLRVSSTSNFGVFFGSGAPSLAAAQGSLYLRSDGSSTSTRLYVNTNGTTGWTNVVTAT